MRQVPEFSPVTGPQFCILGRGRMATHLAAYLEKLGLPFWQWKESRALTSEFFQRLGETSHLLLAVSDGAIAKIVDDLPQITGQIRVHFSGAVTVPGVHSAHPLQTFGPETYSLEDYRRIAFMISSAGPEFSTLLPGLPNPHHRMAEKDRALYHAYCVMAGNFPMLLWAEIRSRFETELKLPASVLAPYLERVCANAVASLANPPGDRSQLTGPIARGDWKTIDQHLKALEGDGLRSFYLSALETFGENADKKKGAENADRT